MNNGKVLERNSSITMETCISSKSADRLVRIFVPGISAKP